MELVAGEESEYGYRKLAICLRRQHNLVINNKKVYRLCKELDILAPQRRLKIKHPRRLAINREVTASDQLWEIDLKYGFIAAEDRFFYLMCIIDVYDRAIVDYHIGLSCKSEHAAQILQRALWKRRLFQTNCRPTIRSDNGPQFISNHFETACNQLGIEHERIPPKTPNKNAHIESFHAILEDNCLSRYEFSSYQEACQTVISYIQFYNERRIHGSLYNYSPYEFRKLSAAGQLSPIIVKV
jgi:putative transposase